MVMFQGKGRMFRLENNWLDCSNVSDKPIVTFDEFPALHHLGYSSCVKQIFHGNILKHCM